VGSANLFAGSFSTDYDGLQEGYEDLVGGEMDMSGTGELRPVCGIKCISSRQLASGPLAWPFGKGMDLNKQTNKQTNMLGNHVKNGIYSLHVIAFPITCF
jgi:hypothetical protein